MFNPFEYLIESAVRDAETRLKNSLRDEIRAITKDICKEMVKELFTSEKDTEREYGYWGHFRDVDTVVMKLKKGIGDKVFQDFTKDQRLTAQTYIRGEEFIDTVIDRIKKKQLNLAER